MSDSLAEDQGWHPSLRDALERIGNLNVVEFLEGPEVDIILSESPALLADRDALAAQVEAVRAALREVEFIGDAREVDWSIPVAIIRGALGDPS